MVGGENHKAEAKSKERERERESGADRRRPVHPCPAAGWRWHVSSHMPTQKLCAKHNFLDAPE